MEKFKLEGYDFIELNKLLKIQNWVSSGGEAKQVIDEGQVKVNGEVEKRRRKKLYAGDKVEMEEEVVIIEKENHQ